MKLIPFLTKLSLLLFCAVGLWDMTAIAAVPDLRNLQKSLQNSLVDVVYELQYDDQGKVGETIGLFCAACNEFHDADLEKLLENGHNIELNGFLVSPDKVIVPDIFVDAGAVKKLFVRFHNQEIACKVSKIYPDNGALLLQLDTSINDGKVLEWAHIKPDDQFFAYSRIREYGSWVTRLKAFPAHPEKHLIGDRLSANIPGNALIVNARGEAVAIFGNNNELVDNEQWSTPWFEWKSVSAEQFEKCINDLTSHLHKSLCPVTVYLAEPQLSRREKLQYPSEALEISSYCLAMPDGKIIMPLLATPAQHGQIEKAVMHLPQGNVNARISTVMKNFGMVQLQPEKSVDIPPVAAALENMTRVMGRMIWAVNVKAYSGTLEIKVAPDALASVMLGFRNRTFGGTLKMGYSSLIFDWDGKLLGLEVRERTFDYNRMLPMLNAVELAEMLDDPQENLPAARMSNPRNSIADLGVEYQAVTPELVQSVGLERLTGNGAEGLLVSYVYPGSTAEKIGLKAGDVLLKLILPDGGRPISLKPHEYSGETEEQFPWEELDRIPEMYFSEIPEPWKGVKNPLNAKLSAIGIGRTVTLIAVCDSKAVKKNFIVENAPVNYQTAPRCKSTALGVEVRDMTFELLRYFRMEKGTPGVIVSDVYAGSPASTAGIKPYEIITAVNEKSVHSSEEFKKALAASSGEISLSVRRLSANRVVTVKLKDGPFR